MASAAPSPTERPVLVHRPSHLERAREVEGKLLVVIAGAWHGKIPENAVTKRLGHSPLRPFLRDNLSDTVETLVLLLGNHLAKEAGRRNILDMLDELAHRQGLGHIFIYTAIPVRPDARHYLRWAEQQFQAHKLPSRCTPVFYTDHA